MYCKKCGTQLPDGSTQCPYCQEPCTSQGASVSPQPVWQETRERSFDGTPVLTGEEYHGMSPQNRKKHSPKPLKWYYFYTYVRLPLVCVTLLVSLMQVLTDQTELLTGGGPLAGLMMGALILDILRLVLSAVCFYGMFNLVKWVYTVNFVLIGMEVLAMTISTSLQTLAAYMTLGGAMAMAFLMSAAIYAVPNFIYFKKRRYLFDPNTQVPWFN